MGLLTMKGLLFLYLVVLLWWGGLVLPAHAAELEYTFVIKETSYRRLCDNKTILTVNDTFPGPNITMNQGDTANIQVINSGNHNITIHWHGVKQPRNPWSDGPEYITQCPIMPGKSFNQTIILSDEIGTLWWHAHSDWSRATVHGLIIVQPKTGDKYPFSQPEEDIPLVLGEWWKSDIQAVLNEFVANGGDPNISDAFLMNGQPGDNHTCSENETFNVIVERGKTYLIRMVNAAMNNILFFAIANHNVTVVGADGSYTKPKATNYIAISPGQTIDFLLTANQTPNYYYMAAHVYNGAPSLRFNNGTTTGIIKYSGKYSPEPQFPDLPLSNDTNAFTSFTFSLRSNASKVDVPKEVKKQLFFTLSMNSLPCEAGNKCIGPEGKRLATSINNVTFQSPPIDILRAYYYKNTSGDYDVHFPEVPPQTFDYTAENLPRDYLNSSRATEVMVLEHNTSVEIVFQGTNLLQGMDHPMHLHGHSFYVVGWGSGNFSEENRSKYILDNPPLMNTIAVPRNGWTAIRFTANNPGVWLMHCHFERHITWGMGMAFIIKNGNGSDEKLPGPPPDMPPC